jgi:hypothetical protein
MSFFYRILPSILSKKASHPVEGPEAEVLALQVDDHSARAVRLLRRQLSAQQRRLHDALPRPRAAAGGSQRAGGLRLSVGAAGSSSAGARGREESCGPGCNQVWLAGPAARRRAWEGTARVCSGAGRAAAAGLQPLRLSPGQRAARGPSRRRGPPALAAAAAAAAAQAGCSARKAWGSRARGWVGGCVNNNQVCDTSFLPRAGSRPAGSPL